MALYRHGIHRPFWLSSITHQSNLASAHNRGRFAKAQARGCATAQSPSDSFVPTQSLLAALNQARMAARSTPPLRTSPVFTIRWTRRKNGRVCRRFRQRRGRSRIRIGARVARRVRVGCQSSHEDGMSATTSQSIIKSGSLAASVIMSTSIQVSE
ncbi:hypothetical protein BCR44DRAFT_1194704 [Catenaria anguillulae PL171]|uniref:Uncharacterized protein n=1 Tax=Catenaria anguillulae PL171 TaxID=765915 RepID=A0A1Y2HGA3_9FUNG|nr:hypothetical protein BCR44DRAFT_1194704 [Catenaria anguillulae PL171]